MSDTCKNSGCKSFGVNDYINAFNFQKEGYQPVVLNPANCRSSGCAKEEIATFIGSFNFQSGVRVTRTVYPNNGGNGGTDITVEYPKDPQFITYKGCLSTIIYPVPAGSTQAQIDEIVQAVLQEAANQKAICDGTDNSGTDGGTGGSVQYPNNPGGPPSVGKTYSNTIQSASICGEGMSAKAKAGLPAATSYSGNTLVVEAGIFIADSISQANDDAISYLNTLIASGAYFDCGWYNEYLDYDCGDGTHVVIPAGVYFSTVSQADANAQAAAAAAVQCDCPIGSFVWGGTSCEDPSNPTHNAPPFVSGSGTISLNFNTGSSDLISRIWKEATFNVPQGTNRKIRVNMSFSGFNGAFAGIVVKRMNPAASCTEYDQLNCITGSSEASKSNSGVFDYTGWGVGQSKFVVYCYVVGSTVPPIPAGGPPVLATMNITFACEA